MNRCSECNAEIKGNGLKGMCKACYQRAKVYAKMPVYDIPPKGEIGYAPDGKVICHCCGMAFKKVLTHAASVHKISASEYKKEFQLNSNSGLIAESTKEKLQKAVKENYDKVVSENLIKKGEKTRFKDGGAGRTKDKLRLQEYNALVRRGMESNYANLKKGHRQKKF